jgi:hypothetical protein
MLNYGQLSRREQAGPLARARLRILLPRKTQANTKPLDAIEAAISLICQDCRRSSRCRFELDARDGL